MPIADAITMNEALERAVPINANILTLCFCKIPAIPRPTETRKEPKHAKIKRPRITAAAEFSSRPPGVLAQNARSSEKNEHK